MNVTLAFLLAYGFGICTGASALLAVSMIVYHRHAGPDAPEPVEPEPDRPPEPRSGLRLTESNGTHRKSVSYLEANQ